MKSRSIIQAILILLTIFFAVKWVINPSGPFEPYLFFITLVLSLLEKFIWKSSDKKSNKSKVSGSGNKILNSNLSTEGSNDLELEGDDNQIINLNN